MIKFSAFGYRNFMGYGNKEQIVRFSGEDINIITGTNGKGKSSILEPISFCLWGKPFSPKKTIQDIINWTNEGGEFVWGEFEKNENHYRIERTRTTEILYVNGVERTGFQSKTDFQREVSRILGIDHNLFRKLVIISADAVKSVPDMTPNQKRKMVEEYFNLRVISLMESMAKNERAQVKTDITILTERTTNNDYAVSMAKDLVADAKVNVENRNNKIKSQIESKKSDTKEEWDDAMDKIEKNDGKIEFQRYEIEGLVERHNAFNSEIEEKKKKFFSEIDDIELQRADLHETIQIANKKVDGEIEVLQEQAELVMTQVVDELKEALESNKVKLATQKSNKSSLVAEIKSFEVKKSELETELTNIDKSRDEIVDDIQVTIKEINDKITQIKSADDYMSIDADEVKAEIKSLEGNLSVLKYEAEQGKKAKEFYDENDVCQTCSSELTDEHKAHEIEKIVAHRKELIKSKNEIVAKIENHQLELANQETTQEFISKYESEIEECQLKIDTEMLKSSNMTNETDWGITSIEHNISTIKSDIGVIDDKIEQYKSTALNIKADIKNPNQTRKLEILRQADEKKSTRLTLDSEEIKLDAKKSELEGEIKLVDNETSPHLDGIKSAWTTISNLESTNAIIKENATASKKRAIASIKELQSTIEEVDSSEEVVKFSTALTEKQENADAETRKLTDAKHNLDVINKNVEVLSDSGVKAHFIKQFIPSLNASVKKYMRYFELPVDVEFDTKLGIKVQNNASRKKSKYWQHSGGQRKRIDFGIMLGFLENVMVILNWRTNLIIFDEFLDEGVDTRGMDDMVEMLQEFSRQFSTGVYVISHKADEDYFKEKWIVSTDDEGFSQIEVKV